MKARLIPSLLPTFAALLASLASCELAAPTVSRRFELKLPPLLSPWPLLECFEVEAYVEGGARGERVIRPGEPLVAEIAPGLHAAFIARPRLEGSGIELAPAGLAVGPLDHGGEARLAWESGPAACVAARLIEGGMPAGLNAGILLERLEGLGYGGWGLDIGAIVKEARAGRLGLSDLRLPAPVAAAVRAGPGQWRFDCPAGPLAIAGDDGVARLSLYPGYHALAGEGGTGSGWLGEDGSWTWIRLPR
jgi:hypothetical protein